jgi:hypothetical protein
MVKKMVNSATATVSHCFGGYVLPEGLIEDSLSSARIVKPIVYMSVEPSRFAARNNKDNAAARSDCASR